MTVTLKDSGSSSAPKKPRRGNTLSLIVLLLGAALMLYPVASTLSNHYKLIRQNEEYAGAVASLSDEAKAEQLRNAHDYNDWLLAAGTHARPPVEGDDGYDYYMTQLTLPESFQIMARIRIPAIDVDLPIYHTTLPKVLYEGAGHMYGSTLPVGGDGTNSVISAHTGMVNAAMFDQLPMLREGDDIYIDVMGERLRYQMTGREVVKPEAYDRVTYEPGKDKITLITCTPYGINTDRLLVHAQRVPLDPDAPEPEVSGWGWSWWMIAVCVLVLGVLLVILVRALRRRFKSAGSSSGKEVE
ncbi:Sortase family protein [Corynebacterium capitovis DSM 44611]|uniref:class C sortase n=1 Tax=Corynebacterium capitovis TaxID=131081 RepID=UPI00036538F9|nr:class C sortase [Corynebacterium capitovis]WKD58177.1 Sortase family protein [Corynebacterium capitovis DSM 44611]